MNPFQKFFTHFFHHFARKENPMRTTTTVTKNPVLLLRVRRASVTRRRTQIQIPLALIRHEFFKNTYSLFHRNSNAVRRLIFANAHGKLNTVKVEIPEIESMFEPVLRLERSVTSGYVYYTVYDGFDNEAGEDISERLYNGLGTGETKKTHRQTSRATWYQFVA